MADPPERAGDGEENHATEEAQPSDPEAPAEPLGDPMFGFSRKEWREIEVSLVANALSVLFIGAAIVLAQIQQMTKTWWIALVGVPFWLLFFHYIDQRVAAERLARGEHLPKMDRLTQQIPVARGLTFFVAHTLTTARVPWAQDASTFWQSTQAASSVRGPVTGLRSTARQGDDAVVAEPLTRTFADITGQESISGTVGAVVRVVEVLDHHQGVAVAPADPRVEVLSRRREDLTGHRVRHYCVIGIISGGDPREVAAVDIEP
jgi:hypothetical protein